MRDAMVKTGVNFEAGSRLSSSDLNAINDKVNEIVDVLNNMDKVEINFNAENENYTSSYYLEDILGLIPNNRRKPGVILRFIEQVNPSKVQWASYFWDEKSPDKWEDLTTWKPYTEDEIIDGGEW